MTRSGFIAVAGRPNVGKSTLVNATRRARRSRSPRTSRRRRAARSAASSTASATASRWQLVLVDLPGVQRPRDALTERMQRRVERELADCDAALFVLNGAERSGGGDRFIAQALAAAKLPVVVARQQGRPARPARRSRRRSTRRRSWSRRASTCARSSRSRRCTGAGVETLRDALVGAAARGPVLLSRRRGARDQPLERAAGRAGPRAGACSARARRCRTRSRCTSRRSSDARTASRWCAPCCGSRASRRRGS